MGNQSCVVDGANPHNMGYFLLNKSSKKLYLSDDTCQCGEHRGFSADHGKFKLGWQPKDVIESGDNDKCWMSGRAGSAVCPAGWIIYNIEDGGTLRIEFNSAGWADFQNRAFIQAYVTNCSSLQVSVTQEEITLEMPSEFSGTDSHRQFKILVSDYNGGEKSAIAGLPAKDRVIPVIEFIPGGGLFAAAYHGIQGDDDAAKHAAVKGGIGLAGGVIAGFFGAVYAQQIAGEAVGNVAMDINGPKDMKGCVRITELSTVPSFPTFLSQAALKNALDIGNGGQVVTENINCAGVVIQRVWWLRHKWICPNSAWPKPKKTWIASDLCDWLKKDGFKTDDLGTSKSAIYDALNDGKVVLCIIRNLHWVTVIGVKDELVYVIDHGGLFAVPAFEFFKHVSNVDVIAPTAAIAVYD